MGVAIVGAMGLWTVPTLAATATFSAATSHRLGNVGILYPNDLDAADVDGDGDLDVAVSSSWQGNAYVLRNDGTGEFALSNVLVGNRDAPGGGGIGRGVSFGDFDLDGDADVLWNWSLYGLRIFRGNGLGGFGSSEWYGEYPSTPHNRCTDSQITSIGLVSACDNGVAINGDLRGGRPATGVAVGDVTGDGVADVVAVYLVGESPSELFVLEGPSYALTSPVIQFEGWVYDVALADLNADGALDAVASAGRIFLNDGAGNLNFVERLVPEHEGAYLGWSVVANDFNGDGAVDLALTLRNDYFVYHNDGSGVFTGRRYDTGALAFGLKEGDFDADGDLDLIYTENHRYGGFWLVKNTICDDLDTRDPLLCATETCSGDPSTGDSDSDGVCNDVDACLGNDASGDGDGDGVCDDTDYCIGDDASGDSDGDGVCDDEDLCTGDDLSGDMDWDGLCDDSDVCPLDPLNDVDGDGVCADDDLCAGNDSTGDSDGDQVCNDLDLCEGNDATGDSDGDLFCDASDNCPTDANADQSDSDADGIGDVCEADTDADGTIDDEDNCPLDYNPDQADSDSDLEGDVCDADDDADGVLDVDDNCPLLINPDQSDFDGDGQGDACDGDDDADGVLDAEDLCPGTPVDVVFNDNGCSGAQWVEYECGTEVDHAGHGDFLSCVTHSANGARSAGLLTNKERAAIVRNAARDK